MKKLLITCYLLCCAQYFFAQPGFHKFMTAGGKQEDDASNIIYDKINERLTYGGLTQGQANYGPFSIPYNGALGGVTLTGDSSFNFTSIDTFPRSMGRIAVDDSGFVYTEFNSYYGTFSVGAVHVNSGLTNGIYISKVAPDGTAQWVFTVGSGNSSAVTWYMNVATNNRHQLFATFYTDTFRFSNGTVLNTVNNNHVYVIKIGSTVAPYFSWIKEQGGPVTGLDYPFFVTADDSGNCYVGGQEESDSFKLAGFLDNNVSTTDHGFLIKMDSLGNGLWAKFAGRPGEYPSFFGDYTEAKVGPDGNLYTCGAAYDLQFYDTLIPSTNYPDRFLIKYSPAGKLLAYAALNLNYWFSGMDIDRYGNIYISGEDNSGVVNGLQWQSTQPGNLTYNFNFFAYKFDSTLTAKWLFHDGTEMGYGMYNTIAADNKENVYYAGYFNDSLKLACADTVLHPITGGPIPEPDVLLIKFNTRCNNPGFVITAPSLNLCSVDTAVLTAPAGYSKYYWYRGNTLLSGATSRQVVRTPGSYWVRVLDTTGCIYQTDTAFVISTAVASITGPAQICYDYDVILYAHGGNTYAWSGGLGTADSIEDFPGQATTYTVTVSSGANCSATASHTVNVYPEVFSNQYQTICSGQTYPFAGQSLSQSGTYNDTLQTIHGCDSVIILQLTVNNAIQTSITDTTCNGVPYVFYGQSLRQTGIYKDTLQNGTGCDSVIILNLNVRSAIQSTITAATCSGAPYMFNGLSLTQTGIYKDTLQAVSGCDSVATLNLSVNSVLQTSITDTTCSGKPYAFNGQSLAQTGIYKDTLQAAAGCDSVVTLNLWVDTTTPPTIARNGDTLSTQLFNTYQWLLNGTTASGSTPSIVVTQNGNYSVVVTGASGCIDTSATLSVTTLGIQNITGEYSVKLFPNPNTGNFTLQFTDDIVRSVEITDAVGRIVAPAIKVSKQQVFNVEQLATGVYILRVVQNSENRSLKFTIVK